MGDREHWEERYREGVRQDSTPSGFVTRHAALLRGRVLDVAAGAGRNAIFLAGLGARVEAIDISWSGLSRARQSAREAGTELFTIQADLGQYPLPAGRYDAVINVRYLQRSLFPSLIAALAPGGFLLFETFLMDQQAIGHPRNPDFLLRRGELKEAFAALTLLEYSEGRFEEPNGPVYLARLLARRP